MSAAGERRLWAILDPTAGHDLAQPPVAFPREVGLPKTVHSHANIPVDPDTLFAFLSDYRHAEVFIDGLERLKPLGRRTKGEGARFEAALRVGPTSFATTLEIKELKPDTLITWASIGEQAQSLSFSLAGHDGATTVDLSISYQEPGGIAAVLVGPLVEQTVQKRAHNALARLGQHFSPSE